MNIFHSPWANGITINSLWNPFSFYIESESNEVHWWALKSTEKKPDLKGFFGSSFFHISTMYWLVATTSIDFKYFSNSEDC